MTFMMLIGVWDDVKDISARFRLLIEIFLVLAFIFITDTYIDDFHGLWGINALPPEFGIPFSVLAGVGIINAVNLIDGVDGYSSGYGILACICFGLMSLRMMRGKSPFRPDKTHLHHLFIDMGFGHLGAALFILMINTMVVLIWLASWKLGASIEAQLYMVIALGFAVTFGFYKLMKIQQNGGPCDEEGYPQGTRLWHLMQRVGKFSHREKGPVWRFLTHIVDSRLLGGGKIA